jgi:hypothetical protein
VRNRLIVTLMLSQFVSAVAASTAGVAAEAKNDGPLTIARQGSFFVGGRKMKSDALSTIPQLAAQGTIMVDQMYVRYQTPLRPLSNASASQAIRDHADPRVLSDRQKLGNHAGWSDGLG